MTSVRNPAMFMIIFPFETPRYRSLEHTCMAKSFTLKTERVTDVSKLPHV